MRLLHTQSILKGCCVAAVPLMLLAGAIAPAQSEEDKKAQVVVTGAYRCSGAGGLQHSITFTATDLGEVRIESVHTNLDGGDCSPRGMQAQTRAEELNCTVGPFTPFLVSRDESSVQVGSSFGFVCEGTKDRIVDIIGELSREILRPTQ